MNKMEGDPSRQLAYLECTVHHVCDHGNRQLQIVDEPCSAIKRVVIIMHPVTITPCATTAELPSNQAARACWCAQEYACRRSRHHGAPLTGVS